MTKDRGFKKLKGRTIKEVEAGPLNQVLLLADDGTVIEINAELGPFDIPVISMKLRKEKLDKLPPHKKPKPVMAEWPYPQPAANKLYPGGSKSFDERKGRHLTPNEVIKEDLKKKKKPASPKPKK